MSGAAAVLISMRSNLSEEDKKQFDKNLDDVGNRVQKVFVYILSGTVLFVATMMFFAMIKKYFG